MKKIISFRVLMMLTLLFGAVSAATAEDRFYLNGMTIKSGETVSLEFQLDNSTNYYGFQADIELPVGLEVVKNSNGKADCYLSNRAEDYTLVSNLVSDSFLRVGAYTNQDIAISGTSGTLLTVKVHTTDDYNGGDLTISNILFTKNDTYEQSFPDYKVEFDKLVEVENITLTNALSLQEGETATLQVTVSPSDATDKSVTWTSSDSSVATVSAEGVVTAVKVGTATITATSANGKTAICAVTVAAKTPEVITVTGIAISKAELSLTEGETATLTATIAPENATDKTVTWTSSDASIATVSAEGVVTAVKAGTVTITAASSNGKTAACAVTVAAKTPEVIAVTGITLSNPRLSLTEGETATLTTTIATENATDKTVTWTSSDSSVASVSAEGVVTAVKAGNATITATSANGKTATCTVTVTAKTPEVIAVTGITLSNTKLSLTEGETATLTATIAPENATDKTVTWSSSDASIATVSDKGVVTAVKAGTATITAASSNGKTATCKVTVAAKVIEVTGITLSNTKLSLTEGETATLTATIAPENATDKTVTWSSTDISIATVSAEGVVTAVKAGTATITAASSNGKTATCTVTVVAKVVEVTSITLSNTKLSLTEGETATLTATIAPENATDKTVTWTSSDKSIATVSDKGVMTAVKVGTANITATSANGKSATCAVTVAANIISVESIVISKAELSLTEGETATLSATITPENATDKTVTWTSSDDSVVTVSDEGIVTAVKAGSATITAASSNGKTATCAVTVAAKVIEVTGITLSNTKLSLTEGETATLTATIAPENATDKTVTWTSSDASIATVSDKGVVTAVKVGTATITATSANGKSASCAVTIAANIISVESIVISKTELSLTEGETTTLTATVAPDNATDKSVTWTSSDDSVATVSDEGIVSAVKAGSATITAASSNGKTATCKVTVLPVLVESLTIDPTEWSGEEGSEFTITATVLPENATDKSLEFESSDTSVATVDSEGNVKVLKEGTCVITVSTVDGSDLKAECIVTGLSGVETILADPNTLVDVYDMNGKLLKKGCSRDELKQLKPAIYILRSGNTVVKAVVK